MHEVLYKEREDYTNTILLDYYTRHDQISSSLVLYNMLNFLYSDFKKKLLKNIYT